VSPQQGLTAPIKKTWYEESLFQDAQDPFTEDGIEEVEALIEEQYLG
jgi:hypothetical protein